MHIKNLDKFYQRVLMNMTNEQTDERKKGRNDRQPKTYVAPPPFSKRGYIEVSDISIKYRYSDILLKKQSKLHLKHLVECCNRLFRCNQTCYCVGMVPVTSVSRYVTSGSRYQSRSSMYIRGLIPQNCTRQFQLGFVKLCSNVLIIV